MKVSGIVYMTCGWNSTGSLVELAHYGSESFINVACGHANSEWPDKVSES